MNDLLLEPPTAPQEERRVVPTGTISPVRKKLLQTIVGLILGTFLLYCIYTIWFTNYYRDTFIELYAQAKTDTLTTTTMTSFGSVSNTLFLVEFFALGITIILLQEHLVKKGRRKLQASGSLAMLTILFGVVAILVVNYRRYYIEIDPDYTALEKILLKLFDDVIIAMGPIANLGKFLLVTIALTILGFSMNKLPRKEGFKEKRMILPLILLLLILLWIALVVTDYLIIENYSPEKEQLVRNLFLTTNITQCLFAGSGLACFTEMTIRLTRVAAG